MLQIRLRSSASSKRTLSNNMYPSSESLTPHMPSSFAILSAFNGFVPQSPTLSAIGIARMVNSPSRTLRCNHSNFPETCLRRPTPWQHAKVRAEALSQNALTSATGIGDIKSMHERRSMESAQLDTRLQNSDSALLRLTDFCVWLEENNTQSYYG